MQICFEEFVTVFVCKLATPGQLVLTCSLGKKKSLLLASTIEMLGQQCTLVLLCVCVYVGLYLAEVYAHVIVCVHVCLQEKEMEREGREAPSLGSLEIFQLLINYIYFKLLIIYKASCTFSLIIN